MMHQRLSDRLDAFADLVAAAGAGVKRRITKAGCQARS